MLVYAFYSLGDNATPTDWLSSLLIVEKKNGSFHPHFLLQDFEIPYSASF